MSAEHRRTICRRVAGLMLAFGLMGFLTPRFALVTAHASAAKVTRTRYELAPGVHLTTIRYPTAPNEVRILALRQGSTPETDVLPATKHYPGYRKPSALGADASAIAAVNGDFAAPNGRPQHLEMVDGELWSTGLQQGVTFARTADGSRAYVGVPSPEIAFSSASLPSTPVAKVNAGPPEGDTIAAFTVRGGPVEPPPGNVTPTPTDLRWCAARLVPTGPIGWSGPSHAREARAYTVEDQPDPCPKTSEHEGTVTGTVVLATRGAGAGAAAIKALEPGDPVQMTWGFAGWPGVVDAISATPMLVDNGRNVAPGYQPGDSYFYNFNPRTAVGVTAGCEDALPSTVCTTYIVTVDGRQTDTHWSHGLRLPNLAKLLMGLGAFDAMNLDGGGGTVMWVARQRPSYCESLPPVGGCLVSRPSDRGGERNGVTALAIIDGPDPGEPSGLRP